MSKKISTIEINGRHYDAVTGAPIGHSQHIVVDHRSETVEHHIKTTKTARKPAKKLTHHRQQHSTTLMRKAVRKPGASTKRHIKIQVNTADLVEQPAAIVVPKLSFGNFDKRRLNHANSVKKSRLISHFSPKPLSYEAAPTGIAPRSVQPANKAAFKMKNTPKPVDNDQALGDMFERAIQEATSHLEPAHKAHKKRRLGLRRQHAKHAHA